MEEEWTHEYAEDCLRRLGICINEHLLPYTMKRDFQKEMQEIIDSFSIVEGFDCMKYEIDTVAMIIDLHDIMVNNPELLLSDYDLETLFNEFLTWWRGRDLTNDDEVRIKAYIHKLERSNMK